MKGVLQHDDWKILQKMFHNQMLTRKDSETCFETDFNEKRSRNMLMRRESETCFATRC
jgi:hypothetical protein